jgi:hypothetical protein
MAEPIKRTHSIRVARPGMFELVVPQRQWVHLVAIETNALIVAL